jgi:hypothetical protein
MSAQVPPDVGVARGAICQALVDFSSGPTASKARANVQGLRDALATLITTPNYYLNLAQTYGDYLLATVSPYKGNKKKRDAIVNYLNMHWFDPAQPGFYFDPNVPVAEIHATGMIYALDLSLASGTTAPIPFDSWWELDYPTVDMLSLVGEEGGDTVSKYVQLHIRTPRPNFVGPPLDKDWILGKTAQAYVTHLGADGQVVTVKVRTNTVVGKRNRKRSARGKSAGRARKGARRKG